MFQSLPGEDKRKPRAPFSGAYESGKWTFQSRFNPHFVIMNKSFSAIRGFSQKGFRKSSGMLTGSDGVYGRRPRRQMPSFNPFQGFLPVLTKLLTYQMVQPR